MVAHYLASVVGDPLLGSMGLATSLHLPGNWIAALLVAIYFFAVPQGERIAIGWLEVLGVIVFAVLGEILEFAAAALGAKKAGGSTRATVFAVIGSMIGATVGVFVGLPVSHCWKCHRCFVVWCVRCNWRCDAWRMDGRQKMERNASCR